MTTTPGGGGGSPGSEVRKDIFLAAPGMAKADLDFRPNEVALLVRIGESLSLPRTRIDDLCSGEM